MVTQAVVRKNWCLAASNTAQWWGMRLLPKPVYELVNYNSVNMETDWFVAGKSWSWCELLGTWTEGTVCVPGCRAGDISVPGALGWPQRCRSWRPAGARLPVSYPRGTEWGPANINRYLFVKSGGRGWKHAFPTSFFKYYEAGAWRGSTGPLTINLDWLLARRRYHWAQGSGLLLRK